MKVDPDVTNYIDSHNEEVRLKYLWYRKRGDLCNAAKEMVKVEQKYLEQNKKAVKLWNALSVEQREEAEELMDAK